MKMNLKKFFHILSFTFEQKERVQKNFEEVENGTSNETPYTTFNFKRNETIYHIFYQ